MPALTVIGLSCPLAVATQTEDLRLELAKEHFALATRLSDLDSGRLWGKPLDGPLLLVDPQTREAIANQADLENRLSARAGVWTGQLPEDVRVANTSLEWAGVRWTMVMWSSLGGSAYERGRLLMHESFHRIQPGLGLESGNPVNSHLDSEAGRVWLRLEMRALAEAMIRDGEQRLQAARNAFLFRAVRHSLAGAEAASEEVALEANEGIAEYTGLRLSGLPPVAQEQRLAVDLERLDASPSLTRSFAYGTGTAWAFLCDEYEPGWRTGIAPKPQLANLAASAIGAVLPDELNLLATARSIAETRYAGGEVFQAEADQAEKRTRRREELQAMFAPGRCLRIETGPAFGYSFDPSSAESLDAERIFYRPFQASDEWGTVDAPEGALVDFGQPMAILLPVPHGSKAETVSWRLQLNQGFVLETPADGEWKVVRKQ